ncbi:MotA/TolQ/ExbB proton channel family protein, partial [Helicobacter ganmani]
MENLIINVIFTAFMFGLAFWDYLSYGKQKHRDFKSIIMSAGVLGTFVGIFVGLQDFDVSNVENSVPSLLAGLKTAFYTSILGMALAILLSILQKSKAVKTDFEN